MRLRQVAGVALILLLPTAVATAAAPSARALYKLLLTRPFPDSALPQGFSSAKISAPNLEQKHHGVGTVQVLVRGPDAHDAIEYSIVKTAGDAKAEFADFRRNPNFGGGNFKVVGRVPGYTAPSALVEGSITAADATGNMVMFGATFAYVVVRNVIVFGINDSVHSATRGNRPAALSLLRAGIKHLRAVQG